jgi:hypothetical protein
MNRRGFFGTLLVAPVAVAGAKAIPPATPAPRVVPILSLAGSDAIIARALRLIGVLCGGESPSAVDLDNGHTALVAMLKHRCQKGLPPPSEEEMTYSLALRLAPEYGVAPSRYVVSRALQAERDR